MDLVWVCRRPQKLAHHLDEGFRVQASGCRVQGAGFRVQGSGFRVQGPGSRAQGSGSRIQGPGFRVTLLNLGRQTIDLRRPERARTKCLRPSWRQPIGKSEVNLPQARFPRGGISMGVHQRNLAFAPGLPPGRNDVPLTQGVQRGLALSVCLQGYLAHKKQRPPRTL